MQDIVTYIPGFIQSEAATRLFRLLKHDTPWNHVRYQKPWGTVFTPRLTNCYGYHDDNPETVSGVDPRAIPDYLQELMDSVTEQISAAFNYVLMSYYRDGRDSISWHSDDEKFLGPEPTIASISLGGERRFLLRNKETREKQEFQLGHGDLLVMHGRCQADWEHHVPKTAKAVDPRINLTFRNAQNIAGSKNYYHYNVGVNMEAHDA
jgi:alkylated DNA repair dioxygenase AlkB